METSSTIFTAGDLVSPLSDTVVNSQTVLKDSIGAVISVKFHPGLEVVELGYTTVAVLINGIVYTFVDIELSHIVEG